METFLSLGYDLKADTEYRNSDRYNLRSVMLNSNPILTGYQVPIASTKDTAHHPSMQLTA
jgi:hypothetical protein